MYIIIIYRYMCVIMPVYIYVVLYIDIRLYIRTPCKWSSGFIMIVHCDWLDMFLFI